MIDVEGYEQHVLNGMRDGIARRLYRKIMLEVHPWAFKDQPGAVEGMIASLVDHGYQAFRFRGYSTASPDKDPEYYRLRFDPSILGPATTDHLGDWEHYLFVAGGEASAQAPEVARTSAEVLT